MNDTLHEMKSDHWCEFLKWFMSTTIRASNTVSIEEITSLFPRSELERDEPSEEYEEAFDSLNAVYRFIGIDVLDDDGEVLNPDYMEESDEEPIEAEQASVN